MNMTTQHREEVRRQFEAWAKSEGWPVHHNGVAYIDDFAQCAWLREAAQEALGLLRILDPQHGVTQQLEAALSAQPATVRCEPCGGMGNIMDMRCIGCNGTGRVSVQHAQGECPKHGDTHKDCGGQWCDYVQPEYKPSATRSFSPDESAIARYVRIGMICDQCGKEHPAAPVGVPDGLNKLLREMIDLHDKRGCVLTIHMERLKKQFAAAPSAPQGVER